MHLYKTIIILILLSLFSINSISAQSVKESVKVVVIEKTVDENGNVTENKVVKEGEEAKRYMDAMKITEDANTWTTNDGETIDLDGKEYKIKKKKKVKMITKDHDGNEEVIEWQGEGEMPKELKEKMEEHDIDIITEEGENQIEVSVDSNGNESHSTIKIMKSDDGNEEDIEIEVEGGELSHEVKKMLEEEGIDLQIFESEDGSEKRIMIVTDEDVDINNNKAQLGVFLDTEDRGVRVAGIMEGSSAESAGMQEGDIITAIGGQKITSMEEVVDEIGKYNVGDVIIVDYLRGDKNESREVTLQKRKSTKVMKEMKSYKKVMGKNQDKMKTKEKYIIIEKEK